VIVVDTSILAYLLIEGERTAACREVLAKDAEWSAPFLWRSEFRNVLTTHMHHAGMSPQGAMDRMEQAERLLSGREYSVASDVVLPFTAAHRVSACDAEFLCLATKLDTRLITTDKRLLARCPEIALSPEWFAGFPEGRGP
jgi:predicted nucleic acid-binding protein